jgi:hypothetical protein
MAFLLPTSISSLKKTKSMKKTRFAGWQFCAALVFLLGSCAGGGSEKTAATDSTAAADLAANAKAVSTFITTPQNMVIVVHKVASFQKWLTAYEEHDSARLANGIHNHVIGRGQKDSNLVVVALRIDDTAKAKAFVKDPGLKKAMQKGGVVGAPTIIFYKAVWDDTSFNSNLRVMASVTVKDWDVWVKSFEDGRQERMDNGIIDRLIGHEQDDSKKVSVVTALTDTAKANAYYKSDASKKRREAAGVVGEPERFAFWVVKRY